MIYNIILLICRAFNYLALCPIAHKNLLRRFPGGAFFILVFLSAYLKQLFYRFENLFIKELICVFDNKIAYKTIKQTEHRTG